jgi:PAS domain S-box-containing protein
MSNPGGEGATLPLTPALSAPADDASFLRGVLEAIPAFVLRLDHEQRIRYVNRVYDGLTLDQFIGRPVREFVASEDLQRFEHAISEAPSTGGLCCYLGKGADTLQSGTPTHHEGYVVPIDRGDSDGRRDVCVVALDVTAHVAREPVLEQSEQQLRLAVEATGIGLWTWDVIHDRIHWNQRIVEMIYTNEGESICEQ